MPVYKTIIKYATNTQPFVALVSKRRSEFERLFTPRFNLDDYEIRQAVKDWSRNLNQIDFVDGDFGPLVEDIFGRLIEVIVERKDKMFPAIRVGRSRKTALDRDMDRCVAEYLALDITIDILQQCFGKGVRRPSPEVMLNAALVLNGRPHEARNFLYHARMPSLDRYYKPKA